MTSTAPMIASHRHHGHCLCGAVKLTLDIERPTLSACHCSMCRRWGGGPLLSVDSHGVPALEGEQHISVYAASEWAERGFCSRCGSHLFYRLRDGSWYSVSPGLFDESGTWPFELQVFVDDKPDNYAFANKTLEMTGEQVVALFAK